MSNIDPSTRQESFKLPESDIEGLESFDDGAPSAQVEPSTTEATPEASPPTPSGTPPAPPPQRPPQPAAVSRSAAPRPSRRRSVSVFWPTVLIMGGALLLLQNLGYVSGLSWETLWRLWPLLLVALGIDTLFARRSALGAVFSALLIFALLGGAIYVVSNASSFPWVSQWVQESAWRSESISFPLGGAERAHVVIDWASVPLRLGALDDSPNLIEGTVIHRGHLNFDASGGRRATVVLDTSSMGVGWSPASWIKAPGLEGTERRWVLGLSPQAPIDLELDGGSGDADVDLRGLQLDEFTLDVASSAVDLWLPYGAYEARIESGSGSLDLWLPPNAGVQLVVDDGSGSLRVEGRLHLVDGRRDRDSVWETDNLRQAESVLRIRLDVASGAVHVRDWE